MYKILILLDNDNIACSLDLMEVASLISSDSGKLVYGIGFNLKENLDNTGLDHLIEVNDDSINAYDALTVAEVLEEVQKQYKFDSILILATSLGKMIAPRLAMKLDTGLVADITGIEVSENEVIMIRPAFDGKIFAGIVCDEKPIMMSVRPNVFKRKVAEFKHDLTKTSFVPDKKPSSGIKIINVKPKQISDDIRKNDLLISGGGGVGDNFDKLNELASRLKGTVSASRRAVDSGYATRAIQVGQSGKTVSPKIYIALGIYGSLQHVEGLKNVESIIAVNTNKNVPICSLASIVVEGDALEFIEKLSKRIDEEIIIK